MLKLITGQLSRGPAPTELPVRGIDDLAPLVQRCQRSERDAIRTLVVTLGPTMLQMVRRVLGHRRPRLADRPTTATGSGPRCRCRFDERRNDFSSRRARWPRRVSTRST